MHFSVLVVGDNVEEQLAPFDQSLEVESDEICETYEELLVKHAGDIAGKDPISWLKDYYGKDYIDENGNLMYLGNPNAQWDWYEIGGRWCDVIVIKDGVYYPSDSVAADYPLYAITGQTCRALKKDIFNVEELLNDKLYAVVDGCSWFEDKESIRRVFENANDEEWITIVDCHI